MNNITQIRKPVIFAIAAAVGCLIAAVLAEPLFVKPAMRYIPPDSIDPPGARFCLTIDDSGSMTGFKRNAVKQAAKDFVNKRNLEKEKVGIVVFSSNSRIFLQLTHDKNQILKTIDDYFHGGGTAFTQALNDSFSVFKNDTETQDDENKLKEQNAKIVLINQKIREQNEKDTQRKINREPLKERKSFILPKIVLFFTDGQNGDRREALQAAQRLSDGDVILYAVATQDGDRNYLAQLTGDASRVFIVDDRNIADAFKQVEEKIQMEIPQPDTDTILTSKQGITPDEETGGVWVPEEFSYSWRMIQPVAWSILLCFGMALLIVLMQNYLLYKPLVNTEQIVLLAIGSGIGGFAAGLGGVFSYNIIPLVAVGRIIGWGILGALLAVGMSFFIPNLKRKLALLGGLSGGVFGAIGFLIFSGVGDTSGRLIGAIILGACIGAMIGWLEIISRNAWLTVVYDLRKTELVNLGTQLVTIGGSSRDVVFIRGAESGVGAFQMNGNTITYKDKNGSRVINAGETMNVAGLEIWICDKEHPVPTGINKFYPMRMCNIPSRQSTSL